MTTTFASIRDEQVALIRGLTPQSLAADRFEYYPGTMPFRDWADLNPTACFRRFAIGDLMEFDPPEVSNADVEWIGCREEITVAYPRDFRAGLANDRDTIALLREDLWSINDEVGPYGHDNYSAAVATDPEAEVEVLDNVLILTLRYRVRYYRDVNSQSYTAMQTSSEQSFQYTTTSATDSYTVTIPKAMTDTTYVVSATISTLGTGGSMAYLAASNSGRTTTQFTLVCSGNLATGTVIDIIVRDRA